MVGTTGPLRRRRTIPPIPATEFKARCLDRRAAEVVITKRGRPYAKIVPVDSGERRFLGYLDGLAEIRGDLTAPTGARVAIHCR